MGEKRDDCWSLVRDRAVSALLTPLEKKEYDSMSQFLAQSVAVANAIVKERDGGGNVFEVQRLWVEHQVTYNKVKYPKGPKNNDEKIEIENANSIHILLSLHAKKDLYKSRCV